MNSEMQEMLKGIIDKYLRSIIQSETEVRSKLIVPLIEWLGYPSEYRAEEFPVYGFEASKRLPAKPADFLLFDNANFAANKQYGEKKINWVQNHSLLVVEAKKPGQMPEVMGQAQFYSQWSKAVAYIVTDGKTIKGYYRNPISSDEFILDCSIIDLWQNESIISFSYDKIKSIKDIDFTKEIEKRVNTELPEKKTSIHNRSEYPSELINHMRIVLGNDSNGLTDIEVTNAFVVKMYCDQDKGRPSRNIFGIPEELVRSEDALLFLDGNLVPLMNGTVSLYRFLNVHHIIFENNILFIDFLFTDKTAISVLTGFHVQDYHVSTRTYNLSRVKKAFDAGTYTIKTKEGDVLVDNMDVDRFMNESEYCIEQEGVLDYWLNRMNQLKTIEEYYGIEFLLRPGLSAEETSELYNAVDVVFDGIAKRRNIFFCDEAEKLFAEIGATETITLNCSDLAKIEWTSLLIHNYRFVPNKISFIPRENDNIDISVEFSAENEEGNG